MLNKKVRLVMNLDGKESLYSIDTKKFDKKLHTQLNVAEC